MLCSLAANKPSISVERVSSTEVIVEWSQPPGGATVTGYVVSYGGEDTAGNETLPENASRFGIMTNAAVYFISVMATSNSESLPGKSVWRNPTLCK